jgi:hypothetical protein
MIKYMLIKNKIYMIHTIGNVKTTIQVHPRAKSKVLHNITHVHAYVKC